ncbi:hypothetical protein [Haloarcula sp. CGMCC 1.2071]|uniref:hypothetical protein n=1 Tax=Haloarcula sp. CGMCC 1.2071 TaxID=3111454 RepID=UPI00300F2366
MADGSVNGDLPFGTTTTTAMEVDQYVDYELASRQLRQNGIQSPDRRISGFSSQLPLLLQWLKTHGRILPWRQTTAPWNVYLSEILLQRTRASAVEGIYDQFFARFPDAKTLQAAPGDEIQSLIATLGFGNQRTRTLNEVADLLVEEHDGEVPQSLEELQRPWRVGPYSARATMLFAFSEPLALVDTNFARVLERVFAYDMPDQPHKSDAVYELLDALVPETAGLCRAFNLAILDLADAICTPSDPDCDRCPLAESCHYAASKDAST